MAISRVNSVTGSDSSGGSSTTIATSAMNATAGNLLFVIARGAANGATMSMADTAGNTFTQIGSTIDNGNLGDVSCWYVPNCKGNSSNIFTCTWNSSIAYRGIIAAQYSGVSTSSPLDVNTTPINTLGGGATVTSNSFTTTNANEVIIGAAGYDSGTISSGTIGGTTANIAADVSALCTVEDLIVSSIQTSQTASLTSTNSNDWIFFTVSFKAAAVTSSNSSHTMLMGMGM